MESIALSEEGDPTIGVNAILDLFDQTLGKNQRFIMDPTGSLLDSNLLTVHVKDMSERTVLIIKTIPGQPHRIGSRIRKTERESVIQMTMTSGQILFIAKTISRMTTVWSDAADGQYLGKLVSSSSCCFKDLSASGANDKLLFRMRSNSGSICCRSWSEFSLTANGATLARIGKTDDESTKVDITLLNPEYFDTLTKVLFIFAGYRLYISYFDKIAKGRACSNGKSKCGHQYRWIILTGFLIMVPLTVLSITVSK